MHGEEQRQEMRPEVDSFIASGESRSNAIEERTVGISISSQNVKLADAFWHFITVEQPEMGGGGRRRRGGGR